MPLASEEANNVASKLTQTAVISSVCCSNNRISLVKVDSFVFDPLIFINESSFFVC